MRRAGFFLLLPLAWAPAASAQPAQTPEAAPAGLATEPHSNSAPEGPVAIFIEAVGYEVNERAVRIAVAKELGLTVTADADAARTQVSIEVAQGGDLVVVLRRANASEMMRVVAAPGRPDELPEAVSLLLGNMARDESAQLVALLRAKPPELEPPPEPEPKPKVPPVQLEASKPKPTSKPQLARRTFNLSAFYPLSLHKHSEQLEINLEGGLIYGRVGALDGLAVSALGITQVDGAARGVQLSGLGNINHGLGRGFRSSGLFNYASAPLEGGALAGLYNHYIGGYGAAVSGLASYSGGPFQGFQFSGLASVQSGALHGAQVSGLVSVANDAVYGAQVSSLVNVASQVSGFQLGLVNVAGRVSGLQFGLVNIADEVGGASIAFVPYVHTRQVSSGLGGATKFTSQSPVQWVNWASTAQLVNTGVRFHAGLLYVMPSLGAESAKNGETNLAPGLSLGVRLPLSRFYADLDANYSRPIRFERERMDLVYRGLVGFAVTKGFGVFAGGGVRHRFVVPDGQRAVLEGEASAGVEFF